MVVQITDKTEKSSISRTIMEALSAWFEVEDAREGYIRDSQEQIFFAAKEEGRCLGFLCLKETGKSTVELAVMGVLPGRHRQGLGRQLFEAARRYAKEAGYAFIQVKTVAMGYYEDYDATNRFYQSVGFKEFEIFPTYWDEANPCQIYIMSV